MHGRFDWSLLIACSVLESCRKMLEVGTSIFFLFFYVQKGTYYRAFEANTYEFSIIGNSTTKAIYSHTKLQIYIFWKADKIQVSRNEKRSSNSLSMCTALKKNSIFYFTNKNVTLQSVTTMFMHKKMHHTHTQCPALKPLCMHAWFRIKTWNACVLSSSRHASYINGPFSSRDLMTSLKLKSNVVRHLGAQVTIGRYGQRNAFGYYCTFTVSDYESVFFFTVGTHSMVRI